MSSHRSLLHRCLFCLPLMGVLCLPGTAAFAQNDPPSLPGFISDPEAEAPSQDLLSPDTPQQVAPSPQARQPQQGQARIDSLPVPPAGQGNQDPRMDLGGMEEFQFEKSEEQIQREVRDQAFNAALQGLLPLRPEEIRKLLEYYDRTQESVEVPVYPTPEPEIAVQHLSLDPGTPPATVKLAFGHVTTLNTLDITGAPWPIDDVSWAGNFDVMDAGPGENGNIIRITPQSEFAQGNMSMRLAGLKTPVIISLRTSRDKVHYRFDAVVPENGPFAESPIIEAGLQTTAGSVDLTRFLQGVPPERATRLDVSGVDGRTSAYHYNGMTYLRTPLKLLSPGWMQSVASADGMRVYEIPETPVVLVSDKGVMQRVRLTEREGLIE